MSKKRSLHSKIVDKIIDIHPVSDAVFVIIFWAVALFWLLGVPTLLGGFARFMGWQEGATVEFSTFMLTFTSFLGFCYFIAFGGDD